MKKYFVIFFVILLIFAFGICASATDDAKSSYEAYGLCVVSKVMEYDDFFNMEKHVDYDSYSKIINFWLGANIDRDINPTNADAVCDLASYVPSNQNSIYTITRFKDFGFIKKEHRAGYKTMCSAGFLNYENEILNPNHPLTYKVFFDMLIHFEDELIDRCGFDVSEGVITDSYSEGQNIILKQSTDKKQTEFKFSRMHSFYVQSEGDVAPYSYNVKRGQIAKIYSFENSIVYVSIKDTEDDFNKNYDFTKAKIYLCNPYVNQIIFVNSNTGNYMAYTYENDLLLYEEKKEITAEDINNYYTDRNCYIILEKGTNKLKYINITG